VSFPPLLEAQRQPGWLEPAGLVCGLQNWRQDHGQKRGMLHSIFGRAGRLLRSSWRDSLDPLYCSGTPYCRYLRRLFSDNPSLVS